MNEASPEPTRPLPLAQFSYRCVCGQSFEIAADAGEATCPACGRSYSRRAFSRAAETLSISAEENSDAFVEGEPREPEIDPWINRRLDHFHIVERIGRGGMGAVYKAVDESLQRYVALKLISTGPPAPGDSQHLSRIMQEARAQARVAHPNVVHIYYVGREEESPFFAMELIQGPTLAERLEAGPLPFEEVIDIALQLVDALEQAAAYDIVHGDVKPGNVLLADGGLVKISDFGLSQRISQGQQAGQIVGTPDYLSPEASRGQLLDFRSDMYSLGVTLFQMTFGRLPYGSESSTVVAKLQSHQTDKIQFPDPWPAAIPESWRDVLARLMAKEPDQRFADYDQLRQALRSLRPVDFPSAGWLPRALAWSIDLALATAVLVIAFTPLRDVLQGIMSLAVLPGAPGLRVALESLTCVVPLAAMVLQAAWGTTPGKKLFHLRIVDMHGLAVSRNLLALRMAFQMIPIWLVPVVGVLGVLKLGFLSGLIQLGAILFVAIDAGFALFFPQRRSVHDLLLGTRVVIDTERRA